MTNFVTIRCGTCGIEFGIPDFFDLEKQHTGAEFFCPNGHSRIYRERVADRLRRDLSRVTQENARLAEQATELRRKAEQADQKRRWIEKRARAGVCADCNRTFANVAQHMKTKHSPKCEVVTLKAVS